MEATAEQIRARWGDAIRAARVGDPGSDSYLTQRQLAEQLQWDPQRVSRMERGIGSMETFAEAAAHLGVELVPDGES